MTPSSFAKLSIRMLVAAFLLLFVPEYFIFASQSIAILVQREGFSAQAIAILIVLLACPATGLILWFLAGWLGRFLLPAGTDRSQAPDYNAWQDAGLAFIGGCLLLEGVLDMSIDVFGNGFYVGGQPHLMWFDLSIGTILFCGWRAIFALPRCIFHTNWQRVLTRLRTKL